jgi:hypothetical protein
MAASLPGGLIAAFFGSGCAQARRKPSEHVPMVIDGELPAR